MTTQMKILPAQQIEFASAFVEETDGDPAKVKLSNANADRSQRKVKQNLLQPHQKVDGFHHVLLLYIGTLKILQFHNQKHVNEECLVVAVGTRDEVKLLCALLFTTSAHGKAIFKVLYYGLDIDVMLAKLF